jgi:hypothetical protein
VLETPITGVTGVDEDSIVQAPLVREQLTNRTIVVRNVFLSKGPASAVWSTLWDRVEHFTLGGLELRGRSRDEVITSPWQRELCTRPGQGLPLHALWLDVPGVLGRRLFVSDGCVRLQQLPEHTTSFFESAAFSMWKAGLMPEDKLCSQWNLVGVVFTEDAVVDSGAGDPCRLVRLPVATQPVEVVPAAWVSDLVVLTRLTHAPGFCCLIEPAGYMVQRSSGAFETRSITRGETRMKYKTLQFVPLSNMPDTSLIAPLSLMPEIVDHDNRQPHPSARQGDGSWGLLPVQFHAVAQFVLSHKPTGEATPTGPRNSSLTLKEITFGGTHHLYVELLKMRVGMNLPVESLNITDCGSGVGNIPMYLSIIEPLIGTLRGIELTPAHHHLAREWVHDVAASIPMAVFNMDKMLDALVCGDITQDDPTRGIMQNSDIIFVNNLLFVEEFPARKAEDKCSLNSVIASKIELWATKPGVMVVTTWPLGWPDDGTGGQFLSAATIEFPAHSFSWLEDPIPGYVALRQPVGPSTAPKKGCRERSQHVQHNVPRP